MKDPYAETLEYFVDALQQQDCKIILMTPNPLRWTPAMKRLYGKPPYRPDDPDGFNVSLSPYADCVRELAKNRKIPIVDVYVAFLAYGKVKGQSIDNLLIDGVHPNDKGHRLVADLLIEEMLDQDPSA